MVRVVSFDIWNTLLRLDTVYREMARILAQVAGIKEGEVYDKILKAYNEAKRMRRLGKVKAGEVVDESLSILARYLNIKKEVIEGVITQVLTSLKPENVLIDEVPHVLRSIKDMGLKLVTLGNVLFWPSTLTRKVLESIGISKFFDAQFYADELGVHKPSGKAFLVVCRVLNVEPEDVLHVGDGIVEDLGGALTVGFKAVLVSNDITKPLSIGKHIHFIPHIKYLIDVVKQLLSA